MCLPRSRETDRGGSKRIPWEVGVGVRRLPCFRGLATRIDVLWRHLQRGLSGRRKSFVRRIVLVYDVFKLRSQFQVLTSSPSLAYFEVDADKVQNIHIRGNTSRQEIHRNQPDMDQPSVNILPPGKLPVRWGTDTEPRTLHRCTHNCGTLRVYGVWTLCGCYVGTLPGHNSCFDS